MSFSVWTHQLTSVFSAHLLKDEELEDSIIDTILINSEDTQIARQLAEEGNYLTVSWGSYLSRSSVLGSVWNIS